MQTPWINFSKMDEISAKQMNVFKTSTSKFEILPDESNSTNNINFPSPDEEVNKRLDIEEINDLSNTNSSEQISIEPETTDDVLEFIDIPAENGILYSFSTDSIVEHISNDSDSVSFGLDPMNNDQQIEDEVVGSINSDFTSFLINSDVDLELIHDHLNSETVHNQQIDHEDVSSMNSDITSLIHNSGDDSELTNDFYDQETVKGQYIQDEVIDVNLVSPSLEQHNIDSDLMKHVLDKEVLNVEPFVVKPIELPKKLLTDSNFIKDFPDLIDKDEVDDIKHSNDLSTDTEITQGKVHIMSKRSSFSCNVEISDFLHTPIIGDKIQNSFDFFDLNDKERPELDTKFTTTKTFYLEDPECHLVCSEIHETTFSSSGIETYGTNHKKNAYNASVVSLHESQLTKEEKSTNSRTNSGKSLNIRVPVVVGEYKIEVCLEDKIDFEEEVIRVNKISKDLILTNYKFIPTQFSQSEGNGTRNAIKGFLIIEGDLNQNIEYSVPDNKSKSTQKIHSKNLFQTIALDLIVHLVQVQKIQISN